MRIPSVNKSHSLCNLVCHGVADLLLLFHFIIQLFIKYEYNINLCGSYEIALKQLGQVCSIKQ